MKTTVACCKCGLTNVFNNSDFRDYPISVKNGIYGIPRKVYCGICGIQCEQRIGR